MIRCITSAHYSMTATVLSQGGFDTTPESPSTVQDLDTGEIKRAWAKDTNIVTSGVQPRTIRCDVKGIISKTSSGGGTYTKITGAGTIDDTDYITMDFLPTETVTKRDRITDIKNRKGVVIWIEEEHTGLPTIFQVMGVTPVLGPYGLHIANHALLARSEVQ